MAYYVERFQEELEQLNQKIWSAAEIKYEEYISSMTRWMA